MNCPFCNQPCIPFQDEPKPKESYWRCHSHRDSSVWVVGRYNDTDTPTMVRYYIDVMIHHYEYRVTVDILSNTTHLYQVMYDAEMAYSWLEEMENMKFPHAVNITPENAKEKVKLYLTFS